MISRPQPDEYAEFAASYVNLVGKDPILKILTNQQNNTYNLLKGLACNKADYTYAEGKWTVKQVAGHMADTERILAYRALCFSREAITLPGFDQDVYIEKSSFNNRSLDDIAGEFKIIRESTLYLFRSITEEQSKRQGIASDHPFSVRGLAYMIAGHELHHLNVLKQRYLII